VLLWHGFVEGCYSKGLPIHGMTPGKITNLLNQKQPVADAAQGWTVVVCSADNELGAMAALLLPHCTPAAGSVTELLAGLPVGIEQLLVICDDTLPDGGATELMQQLRAAQPQATCRFLAYLPRTMAPERLEQLLAQGCDALCCRSSGGTGTVLSALVQALHGQQSVDEVFRRRLRRGSCGHSQRLLKPAEQELLLLVTRGHKAPQIADLRQRRYDTIRRQLSAIYRKTGVQDQRGLIAWALAHGVIRPLDLDSGIHQARSAEIRQRP
jgi:DNA-binding NarL/FixJ family response regulator